jgi:hypothetical protein
MVLYYNIDYIIGFKVSIFGMIGPKICLYKDKYLKQKYKTTIIFDNYICIYLIISL